MKLDYIDNINEYGDNIVRLYDFDMSQAQKFFKILHQFVFSNKNLLDLSTIDFIEARNCNLIFRVSKIDEGIRTSNKKKFFCDLTIPGYEEMLKLLEPFCNRETNGYQWLYDIDSPTDLLFSPGGTW